MEIAEEFGLVSNKPNGKLREEKNVNYASALPKKGLTVVTTILFICGEMTGSGVLALPKAVKDTGWPGVFFVFVCAAISSFTGTILGRCWSLVRENQPAKTDHCADPYPTIAEYAFGRIGRVVVNICVYCTLFGVCTVLLLVASENIQNLLQQVNVQVSLCYWIIINGCILAPFCWLKSPKDFWPIALMATATTAAACILIFIQMLMDIEKASNKTTAYLEQVDRGEIKPLERGFETFFLSFGVILFCFGGMASFPTFQADMKKPKKFTTAVLVAMAIILLMYVPISATGFWVYGDLVEANLFQSLTQGPLVSTATILITVHVICAYVILQNPLSQVLEKPLKLPNQFGWKRVVVRTSITVVIVFTAETCPRFGHVLALVGGSAITLNTFVFPSVFYIQICRRHGRQWKGAKLPKWETPFHIFIIIIGVIGGISATYSAIRGIMDPTAFVPPCYLNITAASRFSGGQPH